MKYFLDTCICVELIRQRNQNVLDRIAKLSVSEFGISSITLAELEYGIYRSQYRAQARDALDKFCETIEVRLFDSHAAAIYGEIRFALERKGTPIGPHDLLIAAHALSQNLVMVTNNTKEFQRVPDLIVENWCLG